MMARGGWLDRARRGIEFGSVGIQSRAYFIGRGVLHTVPGDRRAAALLRCHGVYAPRFVRLWKRVLKVKPPSLVLDIGANYGEMIMACRFPDECRVIAVEPNPPVADALERSIRTHRDAERITLVRKILSDTDREEYAFYADLAWSGTSHALAVPSAERHDYLTVRATTADALVNGCDLRHVAFKCDVEGFEGRVLAGMRQTLASAESFIGLIELHPDQLARAGDASCPIDHLQALGEIRLVDDMARLVPMDGYLADRVQVVVASHSALLCGIDARLRVLSLLHRINCWPFTAPGAPALPRSLEPDPRNGKRRRAARMRALISRAD